MILKVWCFIMGGGLVGVGIDRAISGIYARWEIIILIGVVTLIVAGNQTLIERRK